MLALGVYPEISLSEARKRTLSARELIAKGVDPIQQRRDERALEEEQERRNALTFEAVGREYYEKMTTGLNPKAL